MFPIDVVVLVALWHRERFAYITIGILALLGACVATYHYAQHFTEFVLGEKSNLPCSAVGLTPSCAESSVLVFGFATIPFMALCAFTSIVMITYLAGKSVSR